MSWECPFCDEIQDDMSLVTCACGHIVEDTAKFKVVLTEARKIYAGFWRRFGAFWIDILVMLPFIVLFQYINGLHRNVSFFTIIPSTFLFWGYTIYFHGRWGATLGKMATKIKVVKKDLSPIGYKEAFIRFSVDAFFTSLALIAQHIALSNISVEEFGRLAWSERQNRLKDLYPGWNHAVNLLHQIWIWSEFIVLLTNKKRRALHDFIAGTVVIHREYERTT